MIFGCILFEVGDYDTATKIEDEIIDNIMDILCSNVFICLKDNQEKKILGEKLWKKLAVSLMVNLSSSIHAKNYFLIIELYKLFASAVKNTSRLSNIKFRKYTNYVLDSVGVILK